MCGIAGFLDINSNSQNRIGNAIKMINAINHRGPDSNGYYLNENGLVLCSTRLAIQDLSNYGNQPMHSKSGRYTIVFNGEIYNFKNLKDKFLENQKTLSNSDTEILLLLIEKLGLEETINKIEGMFGFALWDHKKKKLFLFRDRFGEKPLYYGWSNNKFVFASELNSIVSLSFFNNEINKESVNLFLKYSFVPAPFSIFKNINKLEPGNFLTFDPSTNKITKDTYWSAIDISNKNNRKKILFDDPIKELNNKLEKTIQNQMISDAPIGAFLSGGIDSVLITSIMSKLSVKKINTFTVGFYNNEFNEANEAKKIANYLGTNHHETYIEKNKLIDTAKNIALFYDEPFADSSQIPTFLISQFAKTKVTVALSGDGGDELFGGYNRYIFTKKYYNLSRLMPYKLKNLIVHLISSHDSLSNLLLTINNKLNENNLRLNDKKIGKIKQILNSNNFTNFYDRCISIITDNNEDLKNTNINLVQLKNSILSEDFVELMMLLDTVFFLPSDMLCKLDRASMAHSLEVRCPFLSHEIFDFANKIPLELKIDKNFENKKILRDLLKINLPEIDMNKSKKGFGVPLESWLRNDLNDCITDTFSNTEIDNELGIDKNYILNLWYNFQNYKNNYYDRIWSFFVLLTWYKNHKKKLQNNDKN